MAGREGKRGECQTGLVYVWRETGAVRNARPSRGQAASTRKRAQWKESWRSLRCIGSWFFCRLLILLQTELWTLYPRTGIIEWRDGRGFPAKSLCFGWGRQRMICWIFEAVQDDIGVALSVAQFGGKHSKAKPWKGEGSGVLEIVEDHRGDTYRAVYTVKFDQAVYVLHAFQKKSPKGIKTARTDVELVSRRLKSAGEDYEARYGKRKKQ